MNQGKILTGKWVQTNADTIPSQSIHTLMDHNKKLAIADVRLAMRESVKDFMAQHWLLEQSMLSTLEKIEVIEANTDQGGFDFPFAKTLIDLRHSESLIGRRGIIDINDIFPVIPRPEVLEESFTPQAAEYFKSRQQKSWHSANVLRRLRTESGESPQDNPAQRIANNTYFALNILTHSWFKKRGTGGEVTYNAFIHNIGQLAQNYVDPRSKDFAEEAIAYEAQRFVSELPYLKKPHIFAKLINAERQKDHERAKEGRIGMKDDNKIVPLPVPPEFDQF
jgi:hypothetical protein